MRLRIADISIVIAAACAIAGANASMVDTLGARSGQDAAVNAAGALSAVPFPLDHVTLSEPGGAGSFRSASRPGGWVKAFSPEARSERTNLFFSLNTFPFVTVARYAASAPLNGGGVMGLSSAGQTFIETAGPSLSFSKELQPNPYAMLLAGLVLIGLMARQRMGQE